jgi:uncharacterized protein
VTLSEYIRRTVDDELDRVISAVPAISIEGPKAVGKTRTARQRSATQFDLDVETTRVIVQGDPHRLTSGAEPILIDEWQRFPSSWDLVRRSVDDDVRPGRFLLTGSTSPKNPGTHSGAGRIVTVRMRPMTLAERGVSSPTVSLGDLLRGEKPELAGTSAASLDDYAREIIAGGFPAIRTTNPEANHLQFDGYLRRIVDGEFPDAGQGVRKPDSLRRWMTAYAAASSTSASFETIRDAATGGDDDKPAKSTTIPYRDVLQRLWIIDEVPAWLPTRNHLRRLGSAPKHQLADPALAARLLGVSIDALLDGQQGDVSFPRDGTLLGNLFEALATLDVRVFAQHSRAEVRHLRTKNGDHEIDLIVVRPDQRVLAIEAKLTSAVSDRDVRHLNWLQREVGPDLIDAIVLTTGSEAYRRQQDGVGVVPLSLLGP